MGKEHRSIGDIAEAYIKGMPERKMREATRYYAASFCNEHFAGRVLEDNFYEVAKLRAALPIWQDKMLASGEVLRNGFGCDEATIKYFNFRKLKNFLEHKASELGIEIARSDEGVQKRKDQFRRYKCVQYLEIVEGALIAESDQATDDGADTVKTIEAVLQMSYATGTLSSSINEDTR